MPKANAETNEYWKEHVDKFSTFEGSALEYCRQNTLPANKFFYHRKRLSKKKAPKPFAKVKVLKESSMPENPLPDPRWLAQFLLALGGGGR